MSKPVTSRRWGRRFSARRSAPASPWWKRATGPRRTRCPAHRSPGAVRRCRTWSRWSGASMATMIFAAVVAGPGRDAVSPPDLAGDAPVADILHPVVVGILPLFRQDAGLAAFDGLHGLFGQRCHLDVPLQREVGLDHGLAAVAVAHRHGVIVNFFQQTGCFQFGHDCGSGTNRSMPSYWCRRRS